MRASIGLGCSLSVLALIVRAGVAFAHTPEQPPHQLFAEGDLKLESGEVI